MTAWANSRTPKEAQRTTCPFRLGHADTCLVDGCMAWRWERPPYERKISAEVRRELDDPEPGSGFTLTSRADGSFTSKFDGRGFCGLATSPAGMAVLS